MKRIILLAVCVLAVSTGINAQVTSTQSSNEKTTREKLTPEQRAQKNVDDLNALVSLSDDQKVKVKALAIARISKVDAVRKKYKGQAESKETAKNEIDVLRKDYRHSVKDLLTIQQMEKVQAKNKELKATRDAKEPDSALETND